MKNLLVLLFLTVYSLSHAQNDKLLHYGAGVVAGGAGAFLAHEISNGDKWWTIAGAVGTSLIAGMAKEAIDKNKYGTWDNGDLAATVAGGVTVGIAIELFSGRKNRKTASRILETESLYAGQANPFQEALPNLNSWNTSHD